MAKTSLLFIGIKGTALALDRATGQEVWRSKLKGSSFVNVVLDSGELYATTEGEVFRLDPASGAICWNNRLPGLGHGLVTVAQSGNQQAITMREKQQQDEAAAAAAAAAAT
ncbi:MAG TPA: PQQ-binding-like beta-propeller repeat protein [Terriglobales bacterium]|nr:PQQ-binding-like beta-propeller repeat protein [Terriglobales bacterium]